MSAEKKWDSLNDRLPWWAASVVVHLVLAAVVGLVNLASPTQAAEGIPDGGPPLMLSMQLPRVHWEGEPHLLKDHRRWPDHLHEDETPLDRQTHPIEKQQVMTVPPDRLITDLPPSVPERNRIRLPRSAPASRRAAASTQATLDDAPDLDPPIFAALHWLGRHQSPSGAWSVRRYTERCQGTCLALSGNDEFSTGVTGLAVLAFLGAGYTPESAELYEGLRFGEVLRLGLVSLQRSQAPDGWMGPRERNCRWNHIVATCSLFEAYAITGSSSLRRATERAVDCAARALNPCKGCRQSRYGCDHDSYLATLTLLVLQGAEGSGLDVPRRAYSSGHDYFNQLECARPFMPPFRPCYYSPARLNEEAWISMERLLSGPTGASGPVSKFWRDNTLKALLPRQNVLAGSCRHGSWEPLDMWSDEGGRVYATAMNALTLEVCAGRW